MNPELETINTDLAIRAKDLRVVDQDSAARATQLVLIGKDAIKKIKAFFTPLKQAQDEAKRQILEKEKAELAKIEPHVNKLSADIASWRAAEDRKRREAEAAAYRAEQERIRIEADLARKAKEAEEEAERKRLALEREAEALAQREREALAANDQAALEEVAEKREEIKQEAQEAIDVMGKRQDEAIDQAAKAEAELAPAPVIPVAAKTSGLSMRTYWRGEVTELRVLLRAIIDGKVSIDAVSIKVSFLNKFADTIKQECTIHGIRIYPDNRMAETGRQAN